MNMVRRCNYVHVTNKQCYSEYKQFVVVQSLLVHYTEPAASSRTCAHCPPSLTQLSSFPHTALHAPSHSSPHFLTQLFSLPHTALLAPSHSSPHSLTQLSSLPHTALLAPSHSSLHSLTQHFLLHHSSSPSILSSPSHSYLRPSHLSPHPHTPPSDPHQEVGLYGDCSTACSLAERRLFGSSGQGRTHGAY